MIEKIISVWDQEGTINPVKKGVWLIGSEYVLKEYHQKEEVLKTMRVLSGLSKTGLPVARIIPLLNGDSYQIFNQRYYLLFNQLPGKHQNSYRLKEPGWPQKMGWVIGDLHQAFITYQTMEKLDKESLLDELKGWVTDLIQEKKPAFLDGKDLQRTIDQLAIGYDQLPQQLIHRDLHLGNLLFLEEAFSGYIDFDLSHVNIRIFDVAYFLMSLLSGGGQDKLTVRAWLLIAEDLLKAYDEKVSLSPGEKQTIPWVMQAIELLFVAYFLGENNDKMAREAADLFYLVKEHTPKIASIAI